MILFDESTRFISSVGNALSSNLLLNDQEKCQSDPTKVSAYPGHGCWTVSFFVFFFLEFCGFAIPFSTKNSSFSHQSFQTPHIEPMRLWGGFLQLSNFELFEIGDGTTYWETVRKRVLVVFLIVYTLF